MRRVRQLRKWFLMASQTLSHPSCSSQGWNLAGLERRIFNTSASPRVGPRFYNQAAKQPPWVDQVPAGLCRTLLPDYLQLFQQSHAVSAWLPLLIQPAERAGLTTDSILGIRCCLLCSFHIPQSLCLVAQHDYNGAWTVDDISEGQWISEMAEQWEMPEWK